MKDSAPWSGNADFLCSVTNIIKQTGPMSSDRISSMFLETHSIKYVLLGFIRYHKTYNAILLHMQYVKKTNFVRGYGRP
jgi:hypothetical protein